MPILQSTHHNAKAYKEISAEEMGCQNLPIQAGVSNIVSNPIDVQGYNQFLLVFLLSAAMEQLTIVVNNYDDANWTPIGGGSAWLSQTWLGLNFHAIALTPICLTFGRSSNCVFDDQKNVDTNTVYKNLTFTFAEQAPGTGAAVQCSAKFFMFVL